MGQRGSVRSADPAEWQECKDEGKQLKSSWKWKACGKIRVRICGDRLKLQRWVQGMGQIAEETGFLAVFVREGCSGDLWRAAPPTGCACPAQPAPALSAALPHLWALQHYCAEIQGQIMTEILLLILYKAKGDIPEREGGKAGRSHCSLLGDICFAPYFLSWFNSELALSSHSAGEEGREYVLRLWPRVSQGVPGVTSAMFVFPSLQLTQMLRLETCALLACWTFAPCGPACDSVGHQAGNST